MKRNATAIWNGGFKDGAGKISTDSGVLTNTPYSFRARFENEKGTNPEELVAAAHAGCFTMALSLQLSEAGLTADKIETTSTVTLEKTDSGFTITSVHLDVIAKVPSASASEFDAAANNAKTGCPVSKVLNAPITMNAHLEE